MALTISPPTQGIQGTQGTTGPQGSQGPQGPQGNTGAQGGTGLQGTTGAQGTTGSQGATGGTGGTGLQGFQGFQGYQGSIGNQGTTGGTGGTGTQGATGSQGTSGSAVAQGFQGFQGFVGNTGTQGPTGLTGTVNSVTTSGSGISASTTSGAVTINSNATNANTANTIVFRDGSGNFSAGLITATATTARYSDLAENYLADAIYEPGTVLMIGGEKEVTIAQEETTKVAGVVSTAPGYIMNSECTGNFVVAIALTGRVPCKVVGTVKKGDLMISAGDGMAKSTGVYSPKIGQVIGKALENFNGNMGTIEVMVGRF